MRNPKPTPHTWVTEYVDGGTVDGTFWKCSVCTANGGPEWPKRPPPTMGPFLAGLALKLSDDCKIASQQIADYYHSKDEEDFVKAQARARKAALRSKPRPDVVFDQVARNAINFLRENFRNDGAEGETVHLLCDVAEKLEKHLRLSRDWKARCEELERSLQKSGQSAAEWKRKAQDQRTYPQSFDEHSLNRLMSQDLQNGRMSFNWQCEDSILLRLAEPSTEVFAVAESMGLHFEAIQSATAIWFSATAKSDEVAHRFFAEIKGQPAVSAAYLRPNGGEAVRYL